ncbi:MAG: outer membrane lipoprotein LolB [Gammaproteobacteria bacterium]|nr:outer membrane lipoprotein LolB [Gammaproteobacteria bacterium]
MKIIHPNTTLPFFQSTNCRPPLPIISSLRSILLFFIIALMSACTSFDRSSSPSPKVTHVNQLIEWQARGKVLLKNEQEKVSGYFFWHKNGDDFTLSLNSFIGTNVLTLNVKNGLSTLEVDGNSYQGNDPESLIYEVTGNNIPVSTLSSWLLGDVNNNNGYISDKKVVQKRLQSFNYQAPYEPAWLVKYDDYKLVDKLQLPHKLNVQNAKSRIKLTINDWEFIR